MYIVIKAFKSKNKAIYPKIIQLLVTLTHNLLIITEQVLSHIFLSMQDTHKFHIITIRELCPYRTNSSNCNHNYNIIPNKWIKWDNSIKIIITGLQLTIKMQWCLYKSISNRFKPLVMAKHTTINRTIISEFIDWFVTMGSKHIWKNEEENFD